MKIKCPYCGLVVEADGLTEHLVSQHEFDPHKTTEQHKKRMLAVGIDIRDFVVGEEDGDKNSE